MSVRRRLDSPDVDLASLMGLGALLGLAWVLVALSTVRALQAGPGLVSTVIGVATPAVFSLTLFAGGLAVIWYGLADEMMHIAKWTLLGCVGVLVAIVLNSMWLSADGFGFQPALFTLVNAASGGAVLGFLVGIYDAQQRRLRKDLRREHRHSSRLSQRVSVINRILRHDMRHQTQLVRGHAERLRDGDLSPETAAVRITRANDRLLELGEQARKVQELVNGERFCPRALDPTAVVEAARERIAARHPELRVEVDVTDARPIHTTPLLEDVLVELLDNAAVHNQGDEPQAWIKIETHWDAERPVSLSVRDNGPGLPDTEAIRGDRCESQLDHSDGFGLWFVTWVIEEGDGTVEFETPEGTTGTEVRLRLPVPD